MITLEEILKIYPHEVIIDSNTFDFYSFMVSTFKLLDTNYFLQYRQNYFKLWKFDWTEDGWSPHYKFEEKIVKIKIFQIYPELGIYRFYFKEKTDATLVKLLIL
jgi:hypothetical protein